MVNMAMTKKETLSVMTTSWLSLLTNHSHDTSCKKCHVPINVGETVVRKYSAHGKGQSKPRMYHPVCWEELLQ